MRSVDILILAGAGLVAWMLITKAKADQQAATQKAAAPSGGITSQNLAWYLQDIYQRLNDGEARDAAYLTDIYGRLG